MLPKSRQLELWPNSRQKFWQYTHIYRHDVLPFVLAIMPGLIDHLRIGPRRSPGAGYSLVPRYRQGGHFFVFGLLATLFCRYNPRTALHLSQGLLAITLTSLFGLSDELRQAVNPERTFELADLAADIVGAIVAILVYQKSAFYRRLLERDIF